MSVSDCWGWYKAAALVFAADIVGMIDASASSGLEWQLAAIEKCNVWV